jgi:hypothetical protein
MDKQRDPNVRVVDADCLDEALRLKRQGLKPVVLDMAHRDIPGGGMNKKTKLWLNFHLLHAVFRADGSQKEMIAIPSADRILCIFPGFFHPRLQDRRKHTGGRIVPEDQSLSVSGHGTEADNILSFTYSGWSLLPQHDCTQEVQSRQ